jgi:hypothetical protein
VSSVETVTLTADRVRLVWVACLAERADDPEVVIVEGVVGKYYLHRTHLESHRQEIGELLACLPDEFQAARGGGWSFLNACMTRNGEHWGEHTDIERLVCLGIAVRLAKFLFPRAMWLALPGGVPYFCIGEEANEIEEVFQ